MSGKEIAFRKTLGLVGLTEWSEGSDVRFGTNRPQVLLLRSAFMPLSNEKFRYRVRFRRTTCESKTMRLSSNNAPNYPTGLR